MPYTDQHIPSPTDRLGQQLRQLALARNELAEGPFLALCRATAELIDFYHTFWQIEPEPWYRELLYLQQNAASALMIAARAQLTLGQPVAASWLAEQAHALATENRLIAFEHAELLRRAERNRESRAAAVEALNRFPDCAEFRAILDTCDNDELLRLPHEHYHLLRLAQQRLKPRRYVEIGVAAGKSLALVGAGTSAIGVDPETAVEDTLCFHSPETTASLFKLTSDDFFQQGRYEQTWGTQPFDMAFIDGLHLFEQVLRDFINLEQRAAADSIIFIHDSLPISIAGAERERTTMVWTGDVWKAIVCLKSVRPDLEIVTFPVRPSGLAMIRNLDRNSRLLAKQFDTLAAHFMDARLPESMPERFQLLNVTERPFETVLEEIRYRQGAWQ